MDNPTAAGSGAVDPDVTQAGIRLAADYQSWLERAARATVNPGVLRMIDDLAVELRDLGPIDADMATVVHGALESVAAAIGVDGLLARLN